MSLNISKLSEANKNFILYAQKNQNSGNLSLTEQMECDSVELSTNKSKKSKTAFVLALSAAIIAGVAFIINKLKKGRPLDISKIKFDKGVASLLNGKKYTGSVQKVYKNGDRVILDYIDGILKKSTRTGSISFEKVYKTNESGEKLVQVSKGIMKYTLNISQISGDAKAEQLRLSIIMDNVDSMSSSKFKEQTDLIRYKSRAQKAQIDDIHSAKAAKEAQLKAEAEARLKAQASVKKVQPQPESPPETPKAQPQVSADTDKKPKAKPVEVKPTVELEPVELDLSKVETVPAHIFGRTARDEIRQFPQADYSELTSFLEETKNLPLEQSTRLEDYTQKPYDMPLRFMISVNETAAKEGSAIIADEIPEIFKGIDKQLLADTMDKLGLVLDTKKPAVFTLAGKKFNVKFLGSGVIGKVFKIFDETGKSVAVKFFKDPSLTGLQGSFAEIPIMRQANLDGVIDVPRFYMANPVSRLTDSGRSMGGWQMVEYLEENTPLRQGNLRFFDWLKSHGLAFGDYNAGTKLGEYISDVGGVVSRTNNYNPFFIFEGGSFMESLLRGYYKLETADDVIIAIRKLNS